MADYMDTTFSVPADLKETITKNTGYFIQMMPGWVNNLEVDFVSSTEEFGPACHASVKADYRYRRVYLSIYPPWLTANEESRRHTFIHEAMHVLLAPIFEFFRESICEAFKENQQLVNVLRVNWQMCNEATTEDLANCVMGVAKDTEAQRQLPSDVPPTPAVPLT